VGCVFLLVKLLPEKEDEVEQLEVDPKEEKDGDA
jgi:hypothetical protein